MKACAKLGKVPMAVHKVGTRSFQCISTREQTADRAGILLWRAERPSRDQCVANVAMHFTAEVSHYLGEASERFGEQRMESNIAGALGDPGRADQIKEENDPLFLTRAIVSAS